jgi:tRNA threonylcarbamoyladenosine biosynthesis protein TsaB
MYVLGIDTAGPVVGVSLWDGARAELRTQRVSKGSDALLLPWAEDLCRAAGIALRELDGVAVARGPGTFTGIRVGLATAVGLAMSVGCPLVPLSSLQTRQARGGEGALLTMLDARKRRVYALGRGADGEPCGGPGDVHPAEALAWMTGPFRAVGEGAVVYESLVVEAGGTLVDEADHPAVDCLARLGAEALARGEGVAAETAVPVYLRPPDARPSGKGRITRGS